MEKVIEASGLIKRYKGINAVDGLDLTVHRGDVFGFLGPNGAGKSTTIRMATGLVRPTSGHVAVFGHNVWHDRQKALGKVGALVENSSFFKYLTGRENLSIVARLSGHHSKGEIERVLEEVGLTERANSKVRTYSHGMQQRLGIAAAMMGSPELIILDEPTNGLDPQGMKDVRMLIRSLAEKHGMTVFLSSHLLHEVEQVCTRVAIINRGKLVECGNVSDLLSGSDAVDITTNNPQQAAKIIEGVEWASVSHISSEGLTIRLDDHRNAELNRLLVNAGIDVSAFVPRKPTLEEIYMRLTGSVDSDPA
jgi:ABC-2 type transport system ATP-binding protein